MDYHLLGNIVCAEGRVVYQARSNLHGFELDLRLNSFGFFLAGLLSGLFRCLNARFFCVGRCHWLVRSPCNDSSCIIRLSSIVRWGSIVRPIKPTTVNA
ncbi:hypothetical protein BDN70DRAFT_154482 [Pholiota conissans]|uniref:Uncharacterized protein n=1 Tax=Pholiota conissans TaxID=109636 RepID=A0A9P6CXN1_9AGAR|nr:hypothetical protein BDN70DRAFT_154482 [Pholiota conissans]